MYSTCLYCYADLGRNERLPRFPIGRRLAFDAEKGRLWVICPRCGCWNLSPLDERWEVIDACERLYRATRIRASTEHIGLAELDGALTLVRIGRPLRPEFAAWRYGRQFTRRRIRAGLLAGAGLIGFAGASAGLAIGLGGWAVYAGYGMGRWMLTGGPKRQVVTRFRVHGELLRLRMEDAESTRVFRDGGDRYGLALHHADGVLLLRGEDARRALGHVVPALNVFGGAGRAVANAVKLIDHAGSADHYLRFTLNRAKRGSGWIHDFPAVVRLALEMSLHEEVERRALQGELAELEQAWREAEEIAAISDDLLVPTWVTDRLVGFRREAAGPVDITAAAATRSATAP
ncbi:MAG TPA: hypothetical protein VFW98_05405 [Gemmatimonadaceae bacterium]|nr:hypothetical protein [Gemmatimonadaceae bacterium]